MLSNINIPDKLREWLKQEGAKLFPDDYGFVCAVYRYAAKNVGYGFMQQVIEWIWQEDGPAPGFAWGPEYFNKRIRDLENQLAEEREACATLAELPPNAPTPITGEHRRLWQMAADAIRARGKG